MNRLNTDFERETPTAGSGLTRAPAASWRDTPPESPTSSHDDAPVDDERTLTQSRPPSESQPAAPLAEGGPVAARPSDATALSDFVPVDSEPPSSAAARAEPTLSKVSKADIEALRRRPAWQVVVWLALVLLILLALWRGAPH
jgi:hypothetical protein